MFVYLVNSLPGWVYWHHWRKELKRVWAAFGNNGETIRRMNQFVKMLNNSERLSVLTHTQSSWDPQSQNQTPSNVGLRGRRGFFLWSSSSLTPPLPAQSSGAPDAVTPSGPPGGAVTPPTPGPASRGALVQPQTNPRWKSFLSSDVPSHYSSKGNEKGKLNELSSPPFLPPRPLSGFYL